MCSGAQKKGKRPSFHSVLFASQQAFWCTSTCCSDTKHPADLGEDPPCMSASRRWARCSVSSTNGNACFPAFSPAAFPRHSSSPFLSLFYPQSRVPIRARIEEKSPTPLLWRGLYNAPFKANQHIGTSGILIIVSLAF